MPLLPPDDESDWYETEFGPLRLKMECRTGECRVLWVEYPGKISLTDFVFFRDTGKYEAIMMSLQRIIWCDEILPDLTDRLWVDHCNDLIRFQTSPAYRRVIKSGSFIELSTGHYGALDWHVRTWEYPMGWNHSGNFPECLDCVPIDVNGRLSPRSALRLNNGYIVGDESEWIISHVDHHFDMILRGRNLVEIRRIIDKINIRSVKLPDLNWRPV